MAAKTQRANSRVKSSATQRPAAPAKTKPNAKPGAASRSRTKREESPAPAKTKPSNSKPGSKTRPVATSRRGFIEDNELSPGELRELERRVDDLNDRTRYLVVTVLGAGFVLYYNVAEDTYGWNDPAHATLFKRRPAASAIQQMLGENDAIVPCLVNARGELVKKSVKLPEAKRGKLPAQKPETKRESARTRGKRAR